MEIINKKQFSLAVEVHFRSRLNEWSFCNANFESIAAVNTQFITWSGGLDDPRFTLTEFRKLYFFFLTRLLGNNLGRKRFWQPLTYAFVDFEGTRKGFTVRMAQPHVHAIMMTHPHHQNAVEALIAADDLFSDTKPFDPHRGTLANLAEYSMKGIITNLGVIRGREFLWDVFPR